MTPIPIMEHDQRRLAWAAEAEKRLIEYAGWLFRGPDGEPAIPPWLGDEWRGCVAAYYALPDAPRHPAGADWPMLWKRLLDWRITKEPALRNRWQAKVNRALTDAWFQEVA